MASSGPGDTEFHSARSSPPDPGPLVSVVVNNFNYERYVGRAIESALAQTYPRVEVVVVDDGSQDDSPDVIRRFGDEVIAVLKENGGQGSAFNVGFERSTGAIVIFLDSDDYLFPNAIERVVAGYDSSLSKVQFRLTVVDAEDRPLGEYPPPDMALHRGDVVPILLERGYYTTAVASGNAYSRWALDRALPVPEEEFRYGADGYVNAIVPFHGPIGAIDTPLAGYRVHGGNFSVMPGEIDVALFHYTITHEFAVERVIRQAGREAGLQVRPALMERYPGHLEARLASLRLDAARHPVAGDGRLPLAWKGVAATWRYVDMSMVRRLVDTGWFIAVALLPKRLAATTIGWKYVRASRPRAVRWAGRLIRRLTG